MQYRSSSIVGLEGLLEDALAAGGTVTEGGPAQGDARPGPKNDDGDGGGGVSSTDQQTAGTAEAMSASGEPDPLGIRLLMLKPLMLDGRWGCTYACSHMHAHTYTHVYTHTHTHTHTHTNTHTTHACMHAGL